jgi:hypothetical protein
MRTYEFKNEYLRLRSVGFTPQEVYRAGPLFMPAHPRCKEAQQAVRMLKVAREVERKGNQLQGALVLAQQDVKQASNRLAVARRWSRPHPQYAAKLSQRELEVLNAHDKLWAAQRMMALFEFTYGPTVEINT